MQHHESHQTPRFLDEPVRIGPFTIRQWLLALGGLILCWGLGRYLLASLPWTPRLVTSVVVGALPLALSIFDERGRSPLLWPRRIYRYVRTGRERVPGPPKYGPLAFELYDGQPAEEDPPHA